MKQYLLLGLSLVALNACESISDIKMPTFGSGNAERAPMTQDTIQNASPHSSALETEMAEMEQLTGSSVRYESRRAATSPEENAEIEIATSAEPSLKEPAVKTQATQAEMKMAKAATVRKPGSFTPEEAEFRANAEAEIQETLANSGQPTEVTAAPAKQVKNEIIQPQDKVSIHWDEQPETIQKDTQASKLRENLRQSENTVSTPPAMQDNNIASARPQQQTRTTRAIATESAQIAPVPQPAPVAQNNTPAVSAAQPRIAQAPAATTYGSSNRVVQPSSARVQTSITDESNCPKVEILPTARSVTFFEGDDSRQLIARGVIDDIRGGCVATQGGINVNLDILMTGKIGEQGRFQGDKNLEAFITFPYFIAVSDNNGKPVDKKILATAMRFQPIIDDLKHAEKITQFIPITNMGAVDNYTILVGYQLNRKQLEYNRARNINRTDTQFVAPDLQQRNRSRLSVNPLAE